MKRFLLSLISLLYSSLLISQAPELWGIAKSITNNNFYLIYRTDTSLNQPLTEVKWFNTTFEGIPNGSLVKGIQDTLIYGISNLSDGTIKIFQINTTNNNYTVKFQTPNYLLGDQAVGELMRHPNGKYYCMTNTGGENLKGVIFEWDPVENTYNTVHHFNGIDGAHPNSNASLRYCTTDGYFYGLTYSGGANNDGVLFRYNPVSDVYQVVNSFNYPYGVEPNGSVTIVEHNNGDLNILYTLMYGNSNDWGTLCNTRYTASNGQFTTIYHSFSGLYFYNNTQQLNNPIGEIIRMNELNENNDLQFFGMVSNSLQNSYLFYSFALNSVTKQIYTNTEFLFEDFFPTHNSIRTADLFVPSLLPSGAVFGVTNGVDEFNEAGSFIRKYRPLNNTFTQSRNIFSTQGLSNAVFGGRPYIHTYTPCVSASQPVIASSSTNVCNNEQFTLSISSGNLNSSATWKWYSGSCVGQFLGSGASITLNQNSTTTYFVRGEGGCAANGACAQITVYCVPGGTELYFSEYIEGSSNNKALEIYNPSTSQINLTGYTIELYANGSLTPTSNQALIGTLAAGQVYVLANNNAASEFLSIADLTSPVCNFNGDDAIVLKKNNIPIDIIGVTGVDPGAYWTVNGGTGTTSGYTLVRNPQVTGPETNWTIAQNQWVVYPENTSTYLGYHDVSNTVSIQDNQANKRLVIAPNPGNGIIQFKSDNVQYIAIYNQLGQMIDSSQYSVNSDNINIVGLPGGVYFIKINEDVFKYIKH